MQTDLIKVINPTADRELKVGKIASRNHGLEAKRIGLLDNSKPNADKFLEYVGRLLKERYPTIELLPRRKMTRTEADCLQNLIGSCDLVISAFAD
jgi:hypothetical protein